MYIPDISTQPLPVHHVSFSNPPPQASLKSDQTITSLYVSYFPPSDQIKRNKLLTLHTPLYYYIHTINSQSSLKATVYSFFHFASVYQIKNLFTHFSPLKNTNMATDKVEMEKSEGKLKHLGIVRVLAINTVAIVSNLYEYAKKNSGALKSTVGTVENAVSTIVKPVYERFKGVPDEILIFVDKKVDEATTKFDEHAPPLAKKVFSKAYIVVQKGTEVAQGLVHEAQVAGPRAALCHAGSLSKQLAVNQGAMLWYHVNHCPPLHGMAQMAAPTAAHWSQKYNKLVADGKTKGYSIFSYVPLIPVEEISKAYKQVESAAAKKDDAASSSSSDSE